MKNIATDTFDPNFDNGPIENDTLHLNSIFVYNNRLCVSRSHTQEYLCSTIKFFYGLRIPHKTHNAQYFLIIY